MKNCKVNRALVAAALASMLMTSACSSTKTAPAASPAVTFEPAPAKAVEKAKIAVSSYWKEGTFDAITKRLNDAIAAAGQNVEFEVQTIQYVQGNNNGFLDKVKAELAAGNPSADAYPFNFIDSGTLHDGGLTMDLTELIPQNAPVYYSKYKDLFPDTLTGIPTGIFSQPLWSKEALMLRQDFAGAGSGVNTIDGLFKFIDDTIVKPKKPYIMLAYESDLVMQWVLEKGYCDLSAIGEDGYLFCKADDSSYTPIPVESIPGFGDFITAMKQYRKNGSLDYPFNPHEGKEIIGFVYNLVNYYVTSPYTSVSFAAGDFAAQLFTPDMPAYFVDPVYTNELVIPALCDRDKAAEVVRFVEWMYASQDNYDSIIYGVKGKDFGDAGGRYTPLVDGKPLQGEGYEQLNGLFFSWPGSESLYNFDFFRLPSSAPANVETLVADGLKQNRRFSISDYIGTDRKSLDKIMNTSDEIKALCKQRDDTLNALIQSDPATFTKESLASSLDSLAKLNNKWLTDQYAAILKKLVDEKK